jgi:hypothetical protein
MREEGLGIVTKRENFVGALMKLRVSIIVDLHQFTSSKQIVGGSDGDAPYLRPIYMLQSLSKLADFRIAVNSQA